MWSHLSRLSDSCRRGAALGALAAVAATSLVACGSDAKPDRDAAQAFLDAYGRRDVAAAAAHTSSAADATTALTASLAGLPGATPGFHIDDVVDRKDTSSTVEYTATWRFPAQTATWTYSGTLAMSKPAKTWQVQWAATDVAPGLAAGQHLGQARVQPTRAALLDSAGQPLFTEQATVTVGINPAAVTDLPALAAQLAAVPELQSTAAEIVSAVQAAGTQLATVITLRRDVYEQVKPLIYDLPGTAFTEGTALLGPTSTFAQPLLGRVGPAQGDQVAASKGAILAGDVVGIGGLQQALNTQLAGTPGLTVQALDATGKVVKPLATVAAPKIGTPVTLTLDRAAQTAAEATLASVTLPAAVVVTQPSTGRILAVANNAAANGDIAMTGQYPPGSTFKIATYTGVFGSDPTVTPATPVDCPGTTVVNGQTVRNEDEFVKGTIPISSAFAFSCNTSAAMLALKLPPGALYKAAASLGLGQKWDLPVDAFSGSMPTSAQSNELAAEGYGQGQVLVSPLLMAEMAGGAATGTAIAPSLVVGRPGAALAAQTPTVTGYLNTLMRDVVTVPGATGRSLADLPGQVEGKTGTAEFGTADPPQSHSWFAGTRGDLAFSVFVYGGEKSADTSVPITRTLLQNLP